MLFQKVTGVVAIVFIIAMAGCSTAPAESNTQEAPADNTVMILTEGKNVVFHDLEGGSVNDVDNEIEGFTKTPSGLQYRILREGTGTKPISTDRVLTHYKGQTTNGKEFDSSYNRGEPFSTKVLNVVPGWIEGLQLVKEGGMIELIIPSKLGYGESGAGQDIPGGATLQFILELQKVN